MLRADTRDWKNESELRQMLVDRIADAGEMRFHYLQMLENRQLSLPDGAVVNRDTGEIIECIEIVNDNYGTPQIEAKQATAEILGASVSFVKQ